LEYGVGAKSGGREFPPFLALDRIAVPK
jgi:hypothetical protein